MDAWLYLSNIGIGVIVWAVTKFGIPWTNREFHTRIPDGPQANAELTALIQKIWMPELERHLKLYHSGPKVAPAEAPVFRFAPTANPNLAPGTVTVTTSSAPPSAATTTPDTGVPNA